MRLGISPRQIYVLEIHDELIPKQTELLENYTMTRFMSVIEIHVI